MSDVRCPLCVVRRFLCLQKYYELETQGTSDIGPVRALWFRRMGWLLLIGLAHAYLVWNGDILVPYALCGLLLIWWVRRLPAAWLMALAAAILLVGAGLAAAHGLS